MSLITSKTENLLEVDQFIIYVANIFSLTGTCYILFFTFFTGLFFKKYKFLV